MLTMFRLPHTLYEMIPFLYVMTGFLIGRLVENPMAFFSGILFTLAGVMIFNARLNHRSVYNRRGRR